MCPRRRPRTCGRWSTWCRVQRFPCAHGWSGSRHNWGRADGNLRCAVCTAAQYLTITVAGSDSLDPCERGAKIVGGQHRPAAESAFGGSARRLTAWPHRWPSRTKREKESSMADDSGNISLRVHRILFVYAGATWAGMLLIPVFPPGGLSIAMVCSWVTTGTSAWAFVRTRNCKCLWPLCLTLPLTVLFAIFVIWLLVSPVSCRETICPWLHTLNRWSICG